MMLCKMILRSLSSIGYPWRPNGMPMLSPPKARENWHAVRLHSFVRIAHCQQCRRSSMHAVIALVWPVEPVKPSGPFLALHSIRLKTTPQSLEAFSSLFLRCTISDTGAVSSSVRALACRSPSLLHEY